MEDLPSEREIQRSMQGSTPAVFTVTRSLTGCEENGEVKETILLFPDRSYAHMHTYIYIYRVDQNSLDEP